MFDYMNENARHSSEFFFQKNINIHEHDIYNVDDIHVPYGRRDLRRLTIRNAEANLWNTWPGNMKMPALYTFWKEILSIIY